MSTLIITEKSSQARDIAAALGDRFGKILPAEGHLLRLAEPDEVNSAWKSWSCVLLKPDQLFPTRPAREGNKPAKLKAIAAALKGCKKVIIATDCDREGQLIGQEIIEHLHYRGTVERAIFTAQDPKTIQQAFATLKPNQELRSLSECGVSGNDIDYLGDFLDSPSMLQHRREAIEPSDVDPQQAKLTTQEAVHLAKP
jgi:DNA topoisomerase-3